MINSPSADSMIPTVAVRLFSTFVLILPKIKPNRLAIPPHTGMIAAHKLINPSAAEANAHNFALCNSGSRRSGSTSISDNHLGLYSHRPQSLA